MHRRLLCLWPMVGGDRETDLAGGGRRGAGGRARACMHGTWGAAHMTCRGSQKPGPLDRSWHTHRPVKTTGLRPCRRSLVPHRPTSIDWPAGRHHAVVESPAPGGPAGQPKQSITWSHVVLLCSSRPSRTRCAHQSQSQSVGHLCRPAWQWRPCAPARTLHLASPRRLTSD